MKTKFTIFATIFLILNSSFLIHNCFSQWVQMSNGMGNDKYIYCFASDSNNIFAGTWLDYGVYLSTNNGQSWIQSGLYGQSVSSLAIKGNNIFAGTTNGVWLSTNNGQSWTQSGLNGKSASSLAISGNNIFAGTTDGVWLSTNSGQNWTQTAFLFWPIHSLAISGNIIFAGTEDNGVYRSTNNGQSWTESGLSGKDVYSLAISGNNIFAGASTYAVWLSTNNGLNWTETALSGICASPIAISGNNIFAGLSDYPSGQGGVYLSTNNGQNWIQKNQGFNGTPGVRPLIIANNYIFAGTLGYSVWRRPLSDIIGIQNIGSEIPSDYMLHQNYPNPFNPSTKIKFEVPKVGPVKISVFDVTGREVAVLVNETLQAGVYETTFDASGGNGIGLTSGVYFCRMEAGGFSETKRMILVK